MKFWNLGIGEFWNFETLELWDFETLKLWIEFLESTYYLTPIIYDRIIHELIDPWAMSHEPSTIDDRLTNELFDYTL